MTNQPGKLSKEAKTSMLSIAARAALAGHDLTGFEPFTDIGGNPNGYQAKCRRCGRTGWVGEDGWQYSILASVCPEILLPPLPPGLVTKLGRISSETRATMLELAVNATSGNHDLAGCEAVDDYDSHHNGYEARCWRCNLTAWIDDSGMVYSLLADTCPGQDKDQ